MADPTTYKPAPGTIPTDPGVYKFRDDSRRVIYVGKAKNLRARLSNYFQDLSMLHPRTRQMVTTAASVEWTVVANEVEALQLEYTWIKKFDPRFNVRFRDDKSYPVLAVSVGEEIPRAFLYRGPRRKGVRYFGPYSHTWAIRETLDLLGRIFPVRTCSKGVFNRQKQLGRPCLLGYIDKCAAPCVDRVTPVQHREIVTGFCSFLAGNTDAVVRDLTAQMHQAAADLDFEKAAQLRDKVEAVNKVTQQQAVVLGDGTDADVIAVEADELEASIQLFHVRSGRIRGQRGWIVERTDATEQGLAELLSGFIISFYTDATEQEKQTFASEKAVIAGSIDADEQTLAVDDAAGVNDEKLYGTHHYSVIPKEVLVDTEPLDCDALIETLSQLRGTKVDVRVPVRGEKRALSDTVRRNAKEALRQHKLKRVGDLTARSAALQEIQEVLGMAQAPLRIECTDISHIQGSDVVASLVVFEDGIAKKSDYRRYKIKEAAGDGHSNDVASIAEVVRRRFLRHKQDKTFMPQLDAQETSFTEELAESAQQHDTARFAYPPQLFIVDGGAPQVNAAQKVFDELEIDDVMLIGIAKRLEEIWLPGEEEPLIFSRNSQALFLFQHIRDEAHRFAINFHRQQRSQRMRHSQLDAIAGLGTQRRTDLVKHFGSLKKLKEATIEQIQEVKGIGPALSATIFHALHTEEGADTHEH
ncbi:excinuclease ABC subunit UvrC [Corynebacterium sp. sy017]|uniref:excinuclease ABC subunit UvrC n=1 Tax=unclassified Corynebacterium TaxID=2624378 RepID=UPI001184A8F9|nr:MULTISPECIES: excinuclease ABC subunit UvrC [unclassified Corynebacterium]MBP3087669.1 excinuclease ABC subunit UvrC [Corynebacterium sp. sy017]QDZ42657.1 excinuclease ABC subunit UvrC [Corynebacterium sp. sy039]TSD92231.1 excinuclease ABC subunit UvrC [Corynebacterium sp. SY003]